MSALQSDAFVFFGATGDLAYKKIFPALYAMVHRGTLQTPIIGMARAGWSLEKLRERARDESGERGRFRARMHRKAHRPSSLRRRRLYRPRDLPQAAQRAWFGCAADPLSRDSAEHVCAALSRGSANPAARTAHVSSSRNPLAAILPPRRRSTGRCTRSSPEAIDFSHRSLSGQGSGAESAVLPFRQHVSRADLESQYVRNVQITMAENFGVEGRGAFYEEVGAIRDVVQNHLLQVIALLAMDAPVGHESAIDARRKNSPVSRHAARSIPRRSCADSSRLSQREGRGRRTRRSRRSRPCGCTSIPGAGRMCRSTSAPASVCPSRPPK